MPTGPPGTFDASDFIQATIAGGVGSVLGGGKFASGAWTGAYSRAFNDEYEKDHHLAHAAGKEIRRVNKLSTSDFRVEFSAYGYSGGNDFYEIVLAKQYIADQLREMVVNGMLNTLKPQSGDAIEFGVTAGGTVNPKLGIISGIFDVISITRWAAPLINDTTYVFEYSCQNITCEVTGYRNP